MQTNVLKGTIVSMYHNYKFTFCAYNTGSIIYTTTQSTKPLTIHKKMNIQMHITQIQGIIEIFGKTVYT